MSEARALTNVAGNSIACVLIGTWVNAVDREQLEAVLAGHRPFDETTMIDEHPVDVVGGELVGERPASVEVRASTH